MGSDQSTHASPSASASSSSSSTYKRRSADGKNFAYLSPIGSNENINAATTGSGADADSEDAAYKRLSAPNGTPRAASGPSRVPNGSSRTNDVSPAVEAAKVPTLQAQLQAKVSQHVVSGKVNENCSC